MTKSKINSKIFFLIKICIIYLIVCLKSYSDDPNVLKNMVAIGSNNALVKITSEQFDKCLIDEAISDKILNNRIEANQKYSINSTPTIIINEKKLEGSTNFKNIKKKIEKII